VKVLEVGSNDINGTVRGLFSDCDYIGIDVAAGSGVDVVAQGQEFNAPDNSFDTVISCECFEHNPYWQDTLKNMLRICRPSGLVLISCASTGRPEHGTARTNHYSSQLTMDIGWDYYRNLTENNLRQAIDFDQYFEHYTFCTNWESHDLYFVGLLRSNQDPQYALHPLDNSDALASRFAKIEKLSKLNNRGLRAKAKHLFTFLFGELGYSFIRYIRGNGSNI
jgi:SAM-dependent methyltransferase